jgi:predicted molibdopterin-dependent oxidoreductase YjgC
MPDTIAIKVNGKPVEVAPSMSALTAIMASGIASVRRSVQGEPRGPLCGMGICFECRATINGQRHCRSCATVCEDGMDIRTDG